MTIDPKFRFAIQLIVLIAIGISQGTVNLKGAIPVDWIAVATAWAGIIAFTGTAVTTVLSGMGMTVSNRIASAAQVQGVKEIKVDPNLVSQAKVAVGTDATITSTGPKS